jgi:hypothetical protein
LARLHTAAKALDGRTCRFIYEAHSSAIYWPSMSPKEFDFMRELGVKPLVRQ